MKAEAAPCLSVAVQHRHARVSFANVHGHRLRQKNIDELKNKQRGAGHKVGGALSALGRKFNKLTAQVDPELGTEDHINIDDEEEEEEEEVYQAAITNILSNINVTNKQNSPHSLSVACLYAKLVRQAASYAVQCLLQPNPQAPSSEMNTGRRGARRRKVKIVPLLPVG